MSKFIPYFCYSSSLDSEAFNEWKKSHGYDTFELPVGERARALGFGVVFNLFSNYWGGRVLGLNKKDGSSAEGIIFRIPADQWSVIEHKEGLRTGLSQALELDCEVAGDTVRARAFSTPEARATDQGPISVIFKKRVGDAYKKWGIPTDLDVLS